MSDVYHFEAGTAPLLVSIPHLGSQFPEDLKPLYTPTGLQSGDTDWHLDRLYRFARRLGASLLWASYSRYVVDLNRSADDENLYPGQVKTGLCPVYTFAGDPLYQDARSAMADHEIAARRERYWQPYHDKLKQEIQRLLARHGKLLLWDAHSIASVIPRLFEGKLPDLNIGTAGGASCAPEMESAIRKTLQDCAYTWAINGRFRGGYITRHYGDPQAGINAIQLEMCQSTYMEERYPYQWQDNQASKVAPVVEKLVNAAFACL